jgi:hypothetical protein
MFTRKKRKVPFFSKQTEKSLPLKRKRGENPRIVKAEVY